MADPSTAPPLVPASIAEAHYKIRDYIHVTPLITSQSMNMIASHADPSLFLSQEPPSCAPTTAISKATSTTSNGHPALTAPKFNLYFKCENQQKIGAFKARGAHHALIRLISVHGIEHVRSRGVVTHSSGNHAQALALAAKNFDVPSYIVMPAISTPSKIAGTKMYSDNVFFSGSTSTEREAKVQEVIAKTGAILVPPYDHPDIILGQGTAAYEMESQFKEMKLKSRETERTSATTTATTTSTHTVNGTNGTSAPEPSNDSFDVVLTPLGGGGLLAGTAIWFSHTRETSSSTSTSINNNDSNNNSNNNKTKNKKATLIIGTEPSFSGANDAQQGLQSTPPTRIPHVSSLTIADGLRTPVGHLNWTVVSDPSLVHAVYSVTEKQIKQALKLTMERTKLFLEPSAVVPVAVVLFCREFRDMVAARQRAEGGGRPWDVGVILSGGNTTVEAVAKLFGDLGHGDRDGQSLQQMDNKNRKEEAERQTAEVGMDGERRAEDVAG